MLAMILTKIGKTVVYENLIKARAFRAELGGGGGGGGKKANK